MWNICNKGAYMLAAGLYVVLRIEKVGMGNITGVSYRPAAYYAIFTDKERRSYR